MSSKFEAASKKLNEDRKTATEPLVLKPVDGTHLADQDGTYYRVVEASHNGVALEEAPGVWNK
ncbi:MAG TPA: hypothetical protein PK513_00505 [Alphaproteobacteria bacterium]|nr:hypothetical protein [Alphaproteobacteria bacterium]USO06608.1 MAG: hypothetical protein H6859_05480 [Rhodospirillales bacterium]HOO80968.1 hypothetical protein [Alphaproteobacteria bacterium]